MTDLRLGLGLALLNTYPYSYQTKEQIKNSFPGGLDLNNETQKTQAQELFNFNGLLDDEKSQLLIDFFKGEDAILSPDEINLAYEALDKADYDKPEFTGEADGKISGNNLQCGLEQVIGLNIFCAIFQAISDSENNASAQNQ